MPRRVATVGGRPRPAFMPLLSPDLDTVLALEGDWTHAAVTARFVADEETPISLFRRVAAGRRGAFLLESVTGGEQMARYSFFGVDVASSLTFDGARCVLRTPAGETQVDASDPLDALRDWLAGWRVREVPGLPRFQGGAVGYIGFDCMACFERVPLPAGAGVGLPPLAMLLPDELFIFDHVTHTLTVVLHVALDGDRRAAYAAAESRLAVLLERLRTPASGAALAPVSSEAAPVSWRPNRTREDYLHAVSRAKEAITAGEVFQVVVSRRDTAEVEVDPLELYRALRSLNPSPYMFYLALDEVHVVGASPEVLVRLEQGELLVRPIAGTRRRGATADEDLALERDLLADEKELAEHRMLVDLGRNDLGRVAKVGSVRVEHPLHIERYSHVMHIVTDVRATLAEGQDAFDVFRAVFPAGTVSGAPKIRACELLATLEPDRRGVYAGAVGYFDHRGNMDTCIAIRTLVVEPGRVHLQAGAGLVYDSVPEREYEECAEKMGSGRSAVARALARGGTS